MAIDYPYIEVVAELDNTTRSTVTVKYDRGELSITEADIIEAISDRIDAAPEVATITATRHAVTQTPA
jgi:hypothetical protein